MFDTYSVHKLTLHHCDHPFDKRTIADKLEIILWHQIQVMPFTIRHRKGNWELVYVVTPEQRENLFRAVNAMGYVFHRRGISLSELSSETTEYLVQLPLPLFGDILNSPSV